ncbi:probable glutathione S-transferase [Asparagus officinalis]|uniref:probable glutathione S-transferase n=1 Tax=Asparagus officinalis TaxID=4686 RepID=UPI00098E026C|nr:probable glutathione S-transferase [Asparagus officinalis]
MAKEVKLLGTLMSPFVIRVKWAMQMKGIDYEYIEEDLGNKSSLLLKYNPLHKKVPVLVHNEKPICESFVILEYIDETWKDNPILPKDPYAKAMARFWSNFGDEKVSNNLLLVARENLKILEEELNGRKFFGGETIGYADISLGWLATMVGILEEIIEMKIIDEERHPFLSAWVVNFSSLPVINDCLPPRETMLTMFRFVMNKSK